MPLPNNVRAVYDGGDVIGYIYEPTGQMAMPFNDYDTGKTTWKVLKPGAPLYDPYDYEKK